MLAVQPTWAVQQLASAPGEVEVANCRREVANASAEYELARAQAAALGIGRAMPVRFLPYRLNLPRWSLATIFGVVTAGVVAVFAAILDVPAVTGAIAVVMALLVGTAAAALGMRHRSNETFVSESSADRWQEIQGWRRSAAERKSAAAARLAAAREQLDLALAKARRMAHVEALVSVDPYRLTSREFEFFVADLFRALGFRTDVMQGVADQGVDVIAEYEGARFAIQAKRYEGNVGNGAVQEVVAGCAMYGCHRCAVVTTSGFTASAQQLAAANRVDLIDGAGLRQLVRVAYEYYNTGIGRTPPPASLIIKQLT